MKTLLATTALLLLATPAFALNDDINSNNVNSGSFVGIGGNANNAVINNGAGSGTTSLAGGSVSNSGNSSATGGAGGSVSGSGNSSNLNVSTGGTGIGGNQSQSATTGSQSVNVEARKRNPVATAYSAPLVAADDTCMGSSSVGAQGIGLGLSVGSTWHDDDCVRRKDARELHNMGLKPAAIALMCQNEKVRKAMAAAGTDCPEIETEEEHSVPAYSSNADSAKH